jgi:hypothetical protein
MMMWQERNWRSWNYQMMLFGPEKNWGIKLKHLGLLKLLIMSCAIFSMYFLIQNLLQGASLNDITIVHIHLNLVSDLFFICYLMFTFPDWKLLFQTFVRFFVIILLVDRLPSTICGLDILNLTTNSDKNAFF